MCGFFVIFKKKNIQIDTKKFNSSAKLINHRGPDKTGEYNDATLLSKFYRLSILDSSVNGMQPMLSRDKRYLLLFNGEIYNAPELRKKFNKGLFLGHSDTEILLHYLIKYREKALNYLDGMFSFVYYDKIKKQLIIARDRFGMKPLYYYDSVKYLILSSEIKPILKYENIDKANSKSVAQFFFKGSIDHQETTLFDRIKSLEPGHFAKIDEKNFSIKKYWDIRDHKIKYENKIEKETPKLKRLINNSVKKHLLSDHEVGLFLSGGTDSTALAHLISKNTKTKLKTFTYGFTNEKSFNEIKSAKQTVSNLEIENHSILIKAKDIIKNIDSMVKQLESPFTSIRLFGMKKLYEVAKSKKIKVIIEGDGGDEILGGYDYNYLPFLIDEYKKNKNYDLFFKKIDKFICQKKNKKSLRIDYIKNLFITNSFQNGSTSDGTPYVDLSNFKDDFIDEFINEKFYDDKNNLDLNNLQKSQYLDIKYLKLPRSLKYKDRLSMNQGIESRLPFLDHHLASYCYNLPNNFKIKNLSTRHIFKKSVQSISNQSINFKNTKKTIADPQSQWLKAGLKEFTFDTFNSMSFKNMDFFDQKGVLKNFEDFCKNRKINSFPFFQILTYYFFNKNFINYNNKI